jgi:hypothetical protein
MKKQIDTFEACNRVFTLASNYLIVTSVNFQFRLNSDKSKDLFIFIHIKNSDTDTEALSILIYENELKFGIDLILNRTEKECVAAAIRLKMYSPQVLVF